jgi:hypothetical protein
MGSEGDNGFFDDLIAFTKVGDVLTAEVDDVSFSFIFGCIIRIFYQNIK